jgi:hypothetical protein
MPDAAAPPPSHPPVAPVTGRTPYDALSELFQVLGRATPYFVIVAVFVYATIEMTGSWQKAHSDASQDYAKRVETLVKLQESTYGELEKMRAGQIETLEKFSKLNSAILDSMATSQAALMKARDALFAEQQKMNDAEDARKAANRSADQLRAQIDELNKKVWAAESTIDIANRLVVFLDNPGNLALDHRYLSRRYENADSAVTARDGQGKAYYGSYRIPGDQMGEFLGYLAKRFPQFAARLVDQGGEQAARTGSDEFIYEWRSLSKDANFRAAQDDFIENTAYRQLLDRTRKNFTPAGEDKTLLDPDQRSEAFRAVLWSIAVQHGPNTPMLVRALDGVDLRTANDETLIHAIYAERRKVDVYFRGESAATKSLLTVRYRFEEQEAVKMLKETVAKK